MASLNFVYGTMESGKTTKLIQDHYNYTRHNYNVIIIKPKLDTKGGNYIITRTSDKLKVDILIDSEGSFFEEKYFSFIQNANFILVDEVQFLSPKQIKELWALAHGLEKHITCYGLKGNFQGCAFESSALLFSMADNKTELTVTCQCGEVAVFNARKVGGKYTLDGQEIVIDKEKDDIEYVPLCGDCYYKYVYNKEN